MIIYVESPNESTNKVLLELIKTINKVARYNYFVNNWEIKNFKLYHL